MRSEACQPKRKPWIISVSFEGKWKANSLESFQAVLQILSKEQKEKLFEGFEYIISGTLHGVLFNLQEENHTKSASPAARLEQRGIEAQNNVIKRDAPSAGSQSPDQQN